MAIMDGLLLGGLLSGSANLTEAVEEFDEESIPRCAHAIKRSRVVIFLLHATGVVLWVVTAVFRVAAWVERWAGLGQRRGRTGRGGKQGGEGMGSRRGGVKG